MSETDTRQRQLGRPRGSLNKRTKQVREVFQEVFVELGGIDALVEWGRENKSVFYRLYGGKLPDSILRQVERMPEEQSQ